MLENAREWKIKKAVKQKMYGIFSSKINRNEPIFEKENFLQSKSS